jgi:DNA-binding response OmpR family regulator
MTYKVAVIEDELPIQNTYRLNIEKEGLHVEKTEDALEGLILIEPSRPDFFDRGR